MIQHLKVPSGTPGMPPLRIDMEEILNAERRIVEIESVTPLKAPELLSVFNRAFNRASEVYSSLEKERLQAERNLERVTARLVIDKLPGLLKEKGLATSRSPAGSADIREAALALEPEYVEAQDLADTLQCYVTLMKSKVRGIEMAYQSVKKILGETNALTFTSKPTSAGGEGNATAGQTVRSGFGTPRY